MIDWHTERKSTRIMAVNLAEPFGLEIGDSELEELVSAGLHSRSENENTMEVIRLIVCTRYLPDKRASDGPLEQDKIWQG